MAFDIKGLPQLRRRLQAVEKAAGRPLLGQIQLDAERNAKLLVPRKTSNLGRSIDKGELNDQFTIVKATANYAAYVEFGTRPHVIRAKPGKMLAWPKMAADRRLSGKARRTVKGGWIRAKEVHHPGTKPQPFLVPAAKKAIEDNTGAKVIVREWNEAA